MSDAISGHELRVLADRASDGGQEELAMRLHDAAREQEAREAKTCGSQVTVAAS